MDDNSHLFGAAAEAALMQQDEDQWAAALAAAADTVNVDAMNVDAQQQQQQQADNAASSAFAQQIAAAMALTEEERGCALAIKQAVEAAPDLEDLCDFNYAHYALISLHSLEDALRRIEGMQRFRRQYKITDTVEQGVYYLRNFMKQQPAFVLHLDVCPGTWEAIRVLDISKLNPSKALEVSRDKGVDYHWENLVVGLYYMHTTCSVYLSTIRQGVFEIADLEGLGWKNMSMEFEYRRHLELINCYPLKFKTIMAYNTNSFANVAWNLMKPLMDDNSKNCIQLGCQILDPDGSRVSRRLSEFYLQPSLEIAQQNILERARNLLTIRYLNEQTFCL